MFVKKNMMLFVVNAFQDHQQKDKQKDVFHRLNEKAVLLQNQNPFLQMCTWTLASIMIQNDNKY